jgi:hypothetical protein
LEQLLREVEAGRYTLEEGLIQALQAMVTGGDLPLDPAQPPVETHLTGLVRYAEYYVETGADEATKTQLTELLNQLFPTEADLDAVSSPETSGRVPGGLAAVIPNGCVVEGQCLVYRERVIEGNRFKIYYPAVAGPRSGTWWVDKLDAAVDAVDYAVNYYNRLGRGNMQGATILFRPDGDSHLNTTDYAFTRYTVVPAGQACPIIINPKITTITPEQFQQVLAHELFHCYQAQFFSAQMVNAYPHNLWWAEGTAEYFSSLVYPGVRFEESQFVGLFSSSIKTKPLTEMQYETLVFFHFLHQTIGRAGILRLISTMPTGRGAELQQQKLAEFAGMEDLWHRFGQAFYDRRLSRANGELFAITPPEPELVGLAAGNNHNFLAEKPFTLPAYRLLFNPGQGFAISLNHSGADGRSSAQAAGSTIWAGLPSLLGQECTPRDYLLLVTTTNGQNMPHSLDLSSAESDETDCQKDSCLVGKWEVVPNIFWLQFSQMGQDTSDEAIQRVYEGTEGTLYLTFTEEGQFTMEFVNLTAEMTDLVDGLQSENVIVKMRGIINGTNTAGYVVSQPGVLGFNGGTGSMTFTFEMNGSVVSNQTMNFPAGGEGGGTVHYKCYTDRLYYDPFTPNGGAGIWPWPFVRVATP